jgi:hypothetical protein
VEKTAAYFPKKNMKWKESSQIRFPEGALIEDEALKVLLPAGLTPFVLCFDTDIKIWRQTEINSPIPKMPNVPTTSFFRLSPSMTGKRKSVFNPAPSQ